MRGGRAARRLASSRRTPTLANESTVQIGEAFTKLGAVLLKFESNIKAMSSGRHPKHYLIANQSKQKIRRPNTAKKNHSISKNISKYSPTLLR